MPSYERKSLWRAFWDWFTGNPDILGAIQTAKSGQSSGFMPYVFKSDHLQWPAGTLSQKTRKISLNDAKVNRVQDPPRSLKEHILRQLTH